MGNNSFNDLKEYRRSGGGYNSSDKLFDWIFQDVIGVYENCSKLACFARCFTLLPFRITIQFRFIQWMEKHCKCRWLVKLLAMCYSKRTAKLNCSLAPETQIKAGLIFPHGFPLVINPKAVIGYNCIIYPGVQIGSSRTKSGAPVIGNNCFLGHGCHIIGNCKIGDWCFISPGAFVCKDIPAGSVVGFGLNNIISNNGEEVVRLYL